uniref:Methyltransferase type 11 domain-containing protein n=1 Tax=Romanomermis culicivorax TaxID=13658 RepID=A0A915JW81_ROMCU
MIEWLRGYFANLIAIQMKRPQPHKLTWFYVRHLLKGRDKFLTRNCIHLADIRPEHRVLSIGCKEGHGIRRICPIFENNTGKLFVIERSKTLAKHALLYCRLEVDTEQCILYTGHPQNLPFPDNFFDRVIHIDDYYFWEDQVRCLQEIFRCCKPGAKIVSTLDIDWLKMIERRGFMEYGHIDPLNHLWLAEDAGFTNLKFDYFAAHQNFFRRNKQFQAIFYEKPDKATLDARRLNFSDKDLDNLEHLLVQMFNSSYRMQILDKFYPKLTPTPRYELSDR